MLSEQPEREGKPEVEEPDDVPSDASSSTERAHAALDYVGAPRALEGRTLSLAERCIALRELEVWPMPEVMGATEAAEALGASTSNLRTIKGLPRPAASLVRGDLYRAAEIRALAKQRKKVERKD